MKALCSKAPHTAKHFYLNRLLLTRLIRIPAVRLAGSVDVFLFAVLLSWAGLSSAADVPQGFEVVDVLGNLKSPAGFVFSPDGRMFICERMTGELRIAHFDAASQEWRLNPEPFYTFDIPKENGTPVRHRSSGLRDIAFDPDFESNGYMYAFYMKDAPRQNRVVRIKTSAGNPDRAEPGSEQLLLEVPFNDSGASGSHNGGAIEFGPDGKLYITTGDGWNGGDPVQSLTTYTGKLFRIDPDGSIPVDNPFYAEAMGDLRAMYALGLRNPYTMSRHPQTGQLYVNETGGSDKAQILVVEPGANYGHQGYKGLGERTSVWASGAGEAGGKLITGGAWYPSDGYWPSEYHGAYFTALWGSNGAGRGHINYVKSDADPTVMPFGTSIGQSGLKPVLTRVGPDGNLYYLLTTYDSDEGQVQMIRWTGQASAATPTIEPDGGAFSDPVQVSLSSATPEAEVRYTLDGSTPDASSTLFELPFTLNANTVVRARSFKEGLGPSGIAAATFTFGGASNIPPVAQAGPDQTVPPGMLVVLSGADSYDPDGDNLTLSWAWKQTGGPVVELFSAEDAVAYFTPEEEGTYTFEMTVTDGKDAVTDEVAVTVQADPPLDAGLLAYWPLDDSQGEQAADEAGGAHGELTNGPVWSPEQGKVDGALSFDGVDDYVSLGTMDAEEGQALTIAFWFKADDFEVHDARFISKASGVQEDEHFWMVSTLNGTALRFRLKAGGSTTTLISTGSVVAPGSWYHVAAVYDGAQMRIYRDGEEVARTPASGSVHTDAGAPAALGNQPPGAGDRPFDGLLDDVRMYNRALSPSSIAALMDSDSLGHLEPAFVFGDPTGNEEVSALDAALVLQHAVGLIVLEGEAARSADVSGKAGVSALDAALILEFATGLIDCFPAEEGCSEGAAKTERVPLPVLSRPRMDEGRPDVLHHAGQDDR